MPPHPLAQIALTSPAFAPGSAIPPRYACDGQDVSPPLRWSGVPQGTTSLGLLMRDPDAPGGNFIHWRLTQIPPGAAGLATGAVPQGGVPGRNGFGTIGYRGPCPPHGDKPHHYVITVTAQRGGRAIGQGTLTGTYARR